MLSRSVMTLMVTMPWSPPLAVLTCGLVHSDRRIIDAFTVAVEQKGRLSERESCGTKGVQAVDGRFLLRGNIKPVDRRSEYNHVGVFQRLDHVDHAILLYAGALMGKAVLASQATSDLLAGNADDLNRMAALARGHGTCRKNESGKSPTLSSKKGSKWEIIHSHSACV